MLLSFVAALFAHVSQALFDDNRQRRLDLLRRWVNSQQDVKECTVSIIVQELRRKSQKTKRSWLSEAAIREHYFNDDERTKEVMTIPS
jgi:hypothetical protein